MERTLKKKRTNEQKMLWIKTEQMKCKDTRKERITEELDGMKCRKLMKRTTPYKQGP